MAKKLSSVLGIDIGSQKIKVAEIRSQGKTPVVTALGIIDTPEGAVDHTGVYNSDAVGVALKQLLSQAGASSSAAVVSIAGQASVLVRTVEVPRMNPQELRDHMQWEINRNIPFAESTVVSDFKALPDEDPNSANMDVVMAMAPQSAIDTMIACVKKAGRLMGAIDVEPLGLARSLQAGYDSEFSGQTICLVDVGHKTTAINIYKDGKLLMPRQVPIGGEMFTNALQNALAISSEDAEQLKQTVELPEPSDSVLPTFGAPGSTAEFQPYNPFAEDPSPAAATTTDGGASIYDYGTPVPNPFENAEDAPIAPLAPVEPEAPIANADPKVAALIPVVEEFVAEVRRSIDYFKSRGGDVNRVLICGGGSKLKGLVRYMTKSLGVHTEFLDPMKGVTVNARKVAPGYLDEHREEFAVAVGNGLHIFFD
jgi:type IV pilus assembly protein PilM